MSDTLANDGASAPRQAGWRSYPSPPSSGRGGVTMASGDKRSLTHYTAENEEQDEEEHLVKRPRSATRAALMTPPSTRGRRMGDRLGQAWPSTSRHTRCGSDSLFGTWLEDESQLDTPSAQKQRRLLRAPTTETYPVRDTAHNPFLEGGPADVGFTGPYAYHAPWSSEAGLLHSPIKPRLLFRPRSARATCDVPPRNAVSDDEMPMHYPQTPPARGLFASELEARARKTEKDEAPVQTADPDALWLATMAPAKEAPAQPVSQHNLNLLAKLEHVNWSSDGEDSHDD